MFGLGKPRAPRSTDGRRLYAVGDIHGRSDLLDDVLLRIDADRRSGGFDGKPVLIFIGDYVDRGLSSRQTIERLLRLDPAIYDLRFLRGNHEAALLAFLEDPTTGPFWFALGGAETLYSYGIKLPPFTASPAILSATAKALRAAMPPEHMRFFTRLEYYARYGDYLFVHAGLRPGKDLAEQTERDLLEIRDAFLKDKRRFPFVVVHGHSPSDEVTRDQRRIGIDTGAYATGRLSAIRLQNDDIAVLATT